MKFYIKSCFITITVLTALCVISSSAFANDDFFVTGFNKRLMFRLSGFLASTKTDLKVDSKDGVTGTQISFEDDLGLSDRESLPLFDITYRFNPRHMIDFSYVNLSRTRTKVFEDSGTITDGIEWAVGAELSGTFDSEVIRLSYGYSFINDGKKELGMLLGLHVTQLNVAISGRGSLVVVDEEGNVVEAESEADRTYDSGFTVPLPVIGLHGAYAFTEKFHFRGWGQLFALNYDEFEGSLGNAAVMLEYDLFKNFGLGAGYALYRYDLDVDGDEYKGSFNYEFKGPTLFLYASF